MKLSVSIPQEDVAFLDGEAARGAYPSRSAGLHAAVRLLRERELFDDYVETFSESDDVDDVWDAATGDGWA